MGFFSVLPVCPSFAAAPDRPAPSPLKRALDKGNAYAFRIELEKLLQKPAENFFEAIRGLHPLDQGEGFASAGGQNDSVPVMKVKYKKIYFDMVTLAHALLPALGRKDGNGRMPLQIAARGRKNPDVYEALNRYEHLNHDIYEWRGASVWDRYPGMSREDIVWARLPAIELRKTAAAQALLKGDSKGFQEALQKLYKGPAWKLIAILHSRTRGSGQTLFHLAAEFDPAEFESLALKSGSEARQPQGTAASLNEEKEKTALAENIKISREETARSLRELIEFVVPFFWMDKFDKIRFQQIKSARVKAGAAGAVFAAGSVLALTAAFEAEPLQWAALPFAAVAAYGVFKCRAAFKQIRSLKSAP